MNRPLLLCALAALGLTACGGGAGTSNSRSPQQLLGAALSDATARGSVHEFETAQVSGRTVTFSDYLAAHSGRQEITITGGIHANVLIVGGMAYYSSNQAGLVHYFGLSPAAARQVGTRWVSNLPSAPHYAAVALDATLPSALSELKLTGPLTETRPTTLDGQSVVGIKGHVSTPGAGPVTATVYVSKSADPLPIGATYDYSANGAHATLALTDWGAHLPLRAPRDAVAESTLPG